MTKQELLERLFNRITRTPQTTCWIWSGSMKHDGYGRMKFDGKERVAHRIVYEMLSGPVGDGLFLDHVCRNKKCVNPDHLRQVTRSENARHYENGRSFITKVPR